MERTDFEMTAGSVGERHRRIHTCRYAAWFFSHPGLTSEIVSIAGERKVKHQDPIHKNISHNRKPLGKGREASAMPQEGKKRSEKFARVVSLSAEMGELEYRRASRGA